MLTLHDLKKTGASLTARSLLKCEVAAHGLTRTLTWSDGEADGNKMEVEVVQQVAVLTIPIVSELETDLQQEGEIQRP